LCARNRLGRKKPCLFANEEAIARMTEIDKPECRHGHFDLRAHSLRDRK
jgi:hypothetical protein